ncbi:MAG TPA: efflux RND transporter periplasmic adaptor subunit [Hyphomicrobiaceae bacterium]|nr:efflux RND transporter periplasmic adaptor subunit [Hyphomicrobiaceae bacterium]
MTRRLIITGIVVASLLGALSTWQFSVKPMLVKSFLSQMVPPPAVVTAEAAKSERWVEQLTSIGTLIASQGVDITSQVPGVVTEILVESSMDVELGSKLVELDTAVELADLASAKATLEEAEVAHARQVDLMQKKVTSEANLDTARAKRDTAAASVKRIEAVIAQKAIVAPFSGRVGIRKVEKGQYVAPGTVLFSLQALDPIRVDFPMPEQTIGKLRVGQTIQLTVDAYPGQVFQGEIRFLDARVAQETRTLLVRGLLPNQERKLLPGMFANVTVLAGEPKDVVTVPRTAVTFSLYGDSVYVAKPAPAKDGEAQAAAAGNAAVPLIADRRFVKTGEMREDRVAIASGVAAGEEVVTTGQLKLNPGASIHIDNSQSLVRPEPRPKQ